MVLPLLKSDLLTVMQATTKGALKDTKVEFSNKSACCVILASQGYPQKYQTGYEMTIEPEALPHAYVAGAKLDGDGRLLTGGGRVIGLTAVEDSLPLAIEEAYRLAGMVHFENAYCRRDIGRRALKAFQEV